MGRRIPFAPWNLAKLRFRRDSRGPWGTLAPRGYGIAARTFWFAGWLDAARSSQSRTSGRAIRFATHAGQTRVDHSTDPGLGRRIPRPHGTLADSRLRTRRGGTHRNLGWN